MVQMIKGQDLMVDGNIFQKILKGYLMDLMSILTFNKSTVFFLWAGADSVLHALDSTMSEASTERIMIDPYISFIGENGKEHHLKTRFSELIM